METPVMGSVPILPTMMLSSMFTRLVMPVHDVIEHVHQIGDAGLEHDREGDHHGSLDEIFVECESE